MKNSDFFAAKPFTALVFTILFCFAALSCWGGEGSGEDAHDTKSAAPSDQGTDQPVAGDVVVSSDIRSGEWGEDSYVLNAVKVAGDILTLNVSYSGGCEEHVFTLVTSGLFVEAESVQLAALLAHDANEDSCEAWITETYTFDLRVIKKLYQQEYQQDMGAVVLLLGGIGISEERPIVYEFSS